MNPHLYQKGQIPHNLGLRNAAKLEGKTHYFTGKPCSKGHIAKRAVVNGSCMECAKENAVKYRAKRTDEQKEKVKEYAKEKTKLWRLNNPNKESIRIAKANWKKRNPEFVYADAAKRRAAKLNRTPKWLNDGHIYEIECIYKYCQSLRSVGLDYHVDHIVPLQGKTVSGFHVPYNLQVIHAKQNLSKANNYYEGGR